MTPTEPVRPRLGHRGNKIAISTYTFFIGCLKSNGSMVQSPAAATVRVHEKRRMLPVIPVALFDGRMYSGNTIKSMLDTWTANKTPC